MSCSYFCCGEKGRHPEHRQHHSVQSNDWFVFEENDHYDASCNDGDKKNGQNLEHFYAFPLVEVRPFRASSHRRYPTQGSEAQLTDLIKNCQKADIYISLLVENVNAFCQRMHR